MFSKALLLRVDKNKSFVDDNFSTANMAKFVLDAVGVLRGSVIKCLTPNPGVLGSSRIESSGFFRGSVLEQDTSEPKPSTG